jgi:hypothetical protein
MYQAANSIGRAKLPGTGGDTRLATATLTKSRTGL